MKNTATWGMANVEIKLVGNIWTVYADTERFGQHEIMAQCISKAEAETWCRTNGAEPGKTAVQLFEEEMSKPFGKLQIGNAMFRNLRIEDGRYFGYGGGIGGKYTQDITDAIMNCKQDKRGVWKTQFNDRRKTVKFGNACTW